MVRKKTGLSFKDACDKIDEIIGEGPSPIFTTSKPERSDDQRLGDITKLIAGSTAPGIVDTYLRARGLSVTSHVLLGHPAAHTSRTIS